MQKGSAPILFLLAGLIILSGVFYLNKSTLPVDQISPQSENKYSTYTNQQLGFEFKYPNELIIKEDSESEFNKRGNGDFRKNFTNYIQYEPAKVLGAAVVLEKEESFDTNPLTVWVFDNENNLTIDEWYKKYWYYPFVWGDFTTRKESVAPIKEATISGKVGQSGVVDFKAGKPRFIYLSKDQKMYLFGVIGSSGDQILQTFKFLNSQEGEKVKDGCKITGCSGQICSDERVMTTCEFRQEYACYKSAICERQSDGKCGWTQTAELIQCLNQYK